MRKNLLRLGGIAMAVMFAFFAGPAAADISDLVGNWVNTDSDTSGITRVVVTASGGNHVNVQVFGQCHPTDCDWGSVPGKSYFDSVNSNHVHSVMARFNSGFANTIVILRDVSGDRLAFEVMTDFTDGSGRRDYDMNGRLRRDFGPSGPGPMLPPGPGPALSEDCVGFNPNTTDTQFTGGAWKLADGGQWLLDFGGNTAAAHQAADIVHHYHFDQQCFVVRPHASMTYWKRSGQVPRGNMTGQDCISLNPDTAHAAFAGGAWKIVDGPQWVQDFGSNHAAAVQAQAVIQTYRLNRQCFVARPDPPMQYWLAQ